METPVLVVIVIFVLAVIGGGIWAVTAGRTPAASKKNTRTPSTTPPSPPVDTTPPSPPSPPVDTTPPSPPSPPAACGTTVSSTQTNQIMGAGRGGGIVSLNTAYVHNLKVGDCIQTVIASTPSLSTPANTAVRVTSVRSNWELTYALQGPDVPFTNQTAWGTIRVVQ